MRIGRATTPRRAYAFFMPSEGTRGSREGSDRSFKSSAGSRRFMPMSGAVGGIRASPGGGLVQSFGYKGRRSGAWPRLSSAFPSRAPDAPGGQVSDKAEIKLDNQ